MFLPFLFPQFFFLHCLHVSSDFTHFVLRLLCKLLFDSTLTSDVLLKVAFDFPFLVNFESSEWMLLYNLVDFLFLAYFYLLKSFFCSTFCLYISCIFTFWFTHRKLFWSDNLVVHFLEILFLTDFVIVYFFLFFCFHVLIYLVYFGVNYIFFKHFSLQMISLKLFMLKLFPIVCSSFLSRFFWDFWEISLFSFPSVLNFFNRVSCIQSLW